MDNFENEYNDEIRCPHCGEFQTDSWELEDDEGFVECVHCGEDIQYERYVSVSYSSWKGESDSE